MQTYFHFFKVPRDPSKPILHNQLIESKGTRTTHRDTNDECILNTKSPTKSKGKIEDIGLRTITKAYICQCASGGMRIKRKVI
jgi:hypothetical protein